MNHRLVVFLALLAIALCAPVYAADAPTAEPFAVPPDAADSQPPLDGPDFTPAPQPTAGSCIYCAKGFTSSPGGGAASHWGHGANCAAAQADLVAQLTAYADGFCAGVDDYGKCAFQVIYTNPCWYSSAYGHYISDGYTNFGCRIWIC